jgi:hypothetical protein
MSTTWEDYPEDEHYGLEKNNAHRVRERLRAVLDELDAEGDFEVTAEYKLWDLTDQLERRPLFSKGMQALMERKGFQS